MPAYETYFKKLIDERGYSYNIISSLTGIPRSTISNYASGRRKPDIQTACRIMKALNIDISLIGKLFEPVW